jgi:hypothetical protein
MLRPSEQTGTWWLTERGFALVVLVVRYGPGPVTAQLAQTLLGTVS